MLGSSPDQGLTARDFHPQLDFINPRDVFPTRSRQSAHFRSPSKHNDGLPCLGASRFGCCSKEERKFGCVNIKDEPCCGCGPSSPKSCEGDCDQCEDCIEDHQLCADQEECVKDCNECLDEHEQACGQRGQACLETCDDCDFSCFDCIDWNQFEKDKSLGLNYSVPLLGQENEFAIDLSGPDFGAEPNPLSNGFSPQDSDSPWYDMPVAPIDISMHHQCMDNYWSGMLQPQLCPDGTFEYPMQRWGPQMPQFGCHPAAIHGQQQLPLPGLQPHHIPSVPTAQVIAAPPAPAQSVSSNALSCQWVMPCGNTCAAAFASVTDLKKHLKAVHCPKGTTTCGWGDCTATFASEAALTGHISKKHLSAATANDDSGPFKCTFPGCTKSFMYKQVLMSHLASHSGDNKAYCHICDQFLNAEGSNFRRHMASHRPKHEHLVCKWHHLGCKRRFPRLDNLRRHEGCCKFGKKAAIHHHHYHLHNKDGIPH